MTKKEILNKINDIEHSRFFLDMKDHWDKEDFALNRKYAEQLRKLREELRGME